MPATRTLTYGLIFLVALSGVASAQQRSARPGFSLYARALVGEKGEPNLRVSAHIPHSNLVFLKKDGTFEAEYRLYIKILDQKGDRLIDSGVSNKKVSVIDYKQTRSAKHSSTLSRNFDLAAGDYVVRAMVHVKNTHRTFVKEARVAVTDVVETGIGLSKPRMFAIAIDTTGRAPVLRGAAPEETHYVEQVEQPVFAEYDKQPAFQFDVHVDNASGEPAQCQLIYQVVDEDDNQILYGRQIVTVNGPDRQFVVSFGVDDWDTGRYLLNIKGFLEGNDRASETSQPFGLAFSAAILRKQFDVTLEILSYVATPGELEPLKRAPEEERGKAWTEFWAQRDPNPNTPENEALEEHWRRVRYATNNFETGEPGWRSDRGKVYIRHGEPDETETRSDPYLQGEYLIWRYFDRNLTFVFFDRFGLGEYNLTDTDAY